MGVVASELLRRAAAAAVMVGAISISISMRSRDTYLLSTPDSGNDQVLMYR